MILFECTILYMIVYKFILHLSPHHNYLSTLSHSLAHLSYEEREREKKKEEKEKNIKDKRSDSEQI